MFNPEYNVLKVAGSSSGRVLSEETKKKNESKSFKPGYGRRKKAPVWFKT